MASFGDRELDRIPALLGLAEELSGSYFKLSSFDPARYPFDVATLRELDAREIATGVFAQVTRHEAPALRRHHYRICLQDHNVLEALQRGPVALDPLLLYVLTHELCHVVRFCDYRQLFDAPDDGERAAEEARVHRMTSEILAPLRDRGVRDVMDLYAEHRAR